MHMDRKWYQYTTSIQYTRLFTNCELFGCVFDILGWGPIFFVEKYKHFRMSHIVYIYLVGIDYRNKKIHSFFYTCIMGNKQQLPRL